MVCKLYTAFIIGGKKKKKVNKGEALHMKAASFYSSCHFIDPTAVATVSVLVPAQKSTKTFISGFDSTA